MFQQVESSSRRVLRRWTLCVGLVVATSRCGGSDAASDPGARGALVTVTSQGGTWVLDARTRPDQPPVRGSVEVLLDVREAISHAPVDGLRIDVVPTMPAMGHGTTELPRTVPQGGGSYVVEAVHLYMPGRWELHLAMQRPATATLAEATDSAVISLDVR